MAPRLAAPVLTVDARKMHQIDTRNVENLHSMWTVFHRCADVVEEGRRLENLSWRIWNRETFCCDHSNHDVADIERARLQPRQQSARDLPQLSCSVDSAASSDDLESRMTRSRQYSPPLAIHRLDSSRSSLSGLGSSARERHISSFALERMVTSIKERTNPKEALPAHVVEAIPAATASAPSTIFTSNDLTSSTISAPAIASASASSSRRNNDARSSLSSDSTAPLSSTSSRSSRRMDSDTSADSMLMSTHSAARGFAAGKPSSYRSSPRTSAPIPAKSLANDSKKKGLFLLGSSKSSGEDESSLDASMGASTSASRLPLPHKSSLTSQLKRAPEQPKKTTSFKDVVQERTFADEDVFEDSDDEEDDEPAIEDDSDVIDDEDEAEWESGSESEEEEEKLPAFPRIDSKVNLTSRRSLLTTMMHESDRASAMQTMASQLQTSKSQPQLPRVGRTRMTSSPLSNATTVAAAQENIDSEYKTASKPILMPSPSSAALALSPKTTRRNMLAAELTESLRTHLLHERAMKNKTLVASKKGIVRRHTAQGNLSHLREYPRSAPNGRVHGADDEMEEAEEPWRRGIFGQGAIGEYHERGW